MFYSKFDKNKQPVSPPARPGLFLKGSHLPEGCNLHYTLPLLCSLKFILGITNTEKEALCATVDTFEVRAKGFQAGCRRSDRNQFFWRLCDAAFANCAVKIDKFSLLRGEVA
jgi:hypothetical protein